MMSVKYLISAETKRHANIIAESLEVRLEREAVFIPWGPDCVRYEKLMGRSGFKEEQLVGYFSEKEKEYLIRC